MADSQRKTENLLDYKVLFSNSFVKETASFKYYRITVTANTQYTLKSNAPASVENVVTTFLYGRSDTMSTANDGLYTDVAKTITSTDDGYVYIAVRKAGTSTAIPSVSETDFDNGTYTIMLNEGSTALPYWQHSLRKLTTATETIQSGDTIYADGTAITAYTIKGNTVQGGTPTPSNPVNVNGVGNKTANLLNPNTMTAGYAVSDSSGNLSPSANDSASDYIDVSGFTTVYIRSYQTARKWGAFYDENKVFVSGFSFYTSTQTVPQNAVYMRVTITTANLDTAMVVKGSTAPTTFEPYGYKIPISSNQTALTPMYFSQQLFKIGDITDNYVSSGTVTYNTGWIDLGTLDWEITASGNFHSTTIITDMKMITNNDTGNAVCTEFSEVDALSVANVAYSFSSCLNNQRTPFVNKTGFEGMTAAQFKAAMSGVIMYYVKATATTETVTAPSIPTTEGANSITIDTTVQPSEFTATWTGWHDSSVKEYDGTDWQ